MQCPNCFVNIRYSERRYNQCLKCNGTYVFEPKTHPLGLTDTFFSRTVDKLSDNGKYFFTPEQFHFSLNRKQIRQNNSLVIYGFIAVFTLVAARVNSWNAAFIVAFFWICFFAYRIFFAAKTVSLKHEFHEFNYDVLQPWKSVHKKLPSHLIMHEPKKEDLKKNLRGFIVCDSQSMADFLIANKLEKNLNVSALNNVSFPKITHHRDLPVFILHDASFEGYKFVAEIERLYGNEQKIFDLGLRPFDVKEMELAIFRKKVLIAENFNDLTNAENKWLAKGFYTPLFVMKPSHLLDFISNKIERKFAEAENT